MCNARHYLVPWWIHEVKHSTIWPYFGQLLAKFCHSNIQLVFPDRHTYIERLSQHNICKESDHSLVPFNNFYTSLLLYCTFNTWFHNPCPQKWQINILLLIHNQSSFLLVIKAVFHTEAEENKHTSLFIIKPYIRMFTLNIHIIT